MTSDWRTDAARLYDKGWPVGRVAALFGCDEDTTPESSRTAAVVRLLRRAWRYAEDAVGCA